MASDNSFLNEVSEVQEGLDRLLASPRLPALLAQQGYFAPLRKGGTDFESLHRPFPTKVPPAKGPTPEAAAPLPTQGGCLNASGAQQRVARNKSSELDRSSHQSIREAPRTALDRAGSGPLRCRLHVTDLAGERVRPL